MGLIWGFIGPDGGGKTLSMTWIALLQHKLGGSIRTFPGYDVYFPPGTKISQTINIDEWSTLPEELRDLYVFVDEIQNFFGSDRWMSWLNRLFGYLAAQRRHRNLGIAYTVQNLQWLDNRLRWLTHLVVDCFDLSLTPWGRENEIKRGELFRLNIFDHRGFFTGRPGQLWVTGTLRGRALWDHFDSYSRVDIWEGMTRVAIKRPTITLDLTGSGEEPALPSGIQSEVLAEITDTREFLARLVDKGYTPHDIAEIAKRIK